MYKTKICLLYRRGTCPRQNCSFAHGEAELRRFAGPSNDGRNEPIRWMFLLFICLPCRFDHHGGGGDLRDRLDRRHSPRGRRSPGFDRRRPRGRRSPAQGFMRSRSPRTRRDRQDRKRQRVDGDGDVSGGQRIFHDSGYHEGKHLPYDGKDGISEQLIEVKKDMTMLEDHKHQLEVMLEEKVREAESLTSRITGLEDQLDTEREDSRRIKSKLTKFCKLLHRQQRAQEDLKRSQSRLQKFGDQLSSDVLRHGAHEDSSVNIVSDEEPNGGDAFNHHRNPSSKRTLHSGNFGDGKAAKKIGARLEKLTQLDEPLYHANVGNNGSANIGNNGSAITPALAGEISLRVQERKNNQMRARNDSPKNSSLAKYEEDEEVDVDGLDTDFNQGRIEAELENVVV